MAQILGYVLVAFALMLAVGAVTGGAWVRADRAGRGPCELRRDLRMHSAFDEGNDARPAPGSG
jgi:hypothetical protein